MTIRTDAELDHALNTLTSAENASRQEIIRRAVLERYERAGHTNRVHDSSQRAAAKWGDVLQRLGTV